MRAVCRCLWGELSTEFGENSGACDCDAVRTSIGARDKVCHGLRHCRSEARVVRVGFAKLSVGESFKDLVFINLTIAGKIESLKALRLL